MPHFDMGKILQMLPDLAVLAAVYLLVFEDTLEDKKQ